MKCPHCRTEFHIKGLTAINFYVHTDNCAHFFHIGTDIDGFWWITKAVCPSCGKFILHLVRSDGNAMTHGPNGEEYGPDSFENSVLIRPKSSSRHPVPAEVLPEFATEYLQACLVLADSPSASAALSRRSLQHILREKAGVKRRTLYEEIETVVNSGNLPSDIAQNLDHVRKIGNLATHPTMNEVTGEIVPVEQGEAEWCLEVIESLFDFYFVRPADSQRRRREFDNRMSAVKTQPASLTQETL